MNTVKVSGRKTVGGVAKGVTVLINLVWIDMHILKPLLISWKSLYVYAACGAGKIQPTCGFFEGSDDIQFPLHEVVNDFYRFRRQGCHKGHITRAAYITRAAAVLFNDLFMIRASS